MRSGAPVRRREVDWARFDMTTTAPGRVHDPAATAPDRHHMVRLGLAVTKAHTELHGGTLEFASQVGCCTSASVDLPRLTPAGRPPAAPCPGPETA